MVRLFPERVLLIGDTQREVQGALLQAVPSAQVTSVASIFDAIAELSGGGGNGSHNGAPPPPNGAATAHGYTTIIAAAEPIERRPEAAVRTLRELAGDGRLILFGHPTLELLSRKMLQFGCDDYIVTPATVEEIQQVFGNPPMRLAGAAEAPPAEGTGAEGETGQSPPFPAAPAPAMAPLPLADVLLDAMLQHPHSPLGDALAQLNGVLGPSMELSYRTGSQAAPQPRSDGEAVLSHAVRVSNETAGTLYLIVPADSDQTVARHTLAQLAHMFGKVATLSDRHNRLQKLAITDELTGVYNARYFRHFLARILDKAKKLHFPVTLLLFDIDDFKKYNDQFGHGVGDEILKQTAAMMKRATREHDLVARIGGDEFAVVFWDKEGPRQPREPRPGAVSRPPQTPLQIFERFKRMIAGDEFTALGKSGKGVLGISAGLAVYPYEATDAATLIQEADRALMQGAKKRTGKNTIFIVGSDNLQKPQADQRG